MKIKVQERLGLQWQRQPVLVETGLPLEKDYHQSSIYIDSNCIPSDLFRMNDRIYASFGMELEPYSQKIITVGPRRFFEPLLLHEIQNDSHIVKWLGRSVKIPVSGLYQRENVPSFITSFTFDGEEFIKEGWFNSGLHREIRIETKFIVKGYQICIAQVDYLSNSNLLIRAEITINGQFTEINVSENINSENEISSVFRFSPNFIKSKSKLHTPRLTNFSKDFWERVEFFPKEQNGVSFKLQPFYAWDVNAGTYLAATSKDMVINIVPVHASKWENASNMRLKASFNDEKLIVEAAGFKGKREWILSVIDEKKDFIDIEPVKFTGGYNNYYYQIDKELNETNYAERLIACHSAQSIGKLFKNTIIERKSGRTSPGVLVNRQEVPIIRSKCQKDDFIMRILENQQNAVLGFDKAGIYLLNDDKDTVIELTDSIREWLKTRVGLFFNLGYSSVHLECIALSRPLRDVATDLDIICNDIKPSDKEWLFSALAYLTCIIDDRDYWPAVDAGFNMGNKNFHSDMYACLGVCACVLEGHEKAKSWIEYVIKEFNKELESSIYPGGAWAEAPTYHLASLSHLLVLAAALKNCGYKNFFLEPQLVETMMFLYHIQTPVDPRCGFAMIPSLGDTTSNILTQSWQALFAWVAKNSYLEIPEFSALMMRAWHDGGSMRIPFSYNSGLKLALGMVNPDLPAAVKREHKSMQFEGFGVILKKSSGSELKGYVALKAGEINNHYDHDEGTIIWYSNGVPLLIDYGTQYNPGIDQSFWHNRISIDHKSDWCRGKVTEFVAEDDFDYVKMLVTIDKVQEWPEYPDRDPEFNFRSLPDPYEIPKTTWIREVVYLKEIDSLVIMDEVDGNMPYDWNLHVLSEDAVKYDDRVTFSCMKGIEMDVHIRNESYESLKLSEWEHCGLDETRIPLAWRDYSWMWNREIGSMGEKTSILRIDKKAPSKFIAILSARNKNANPFKISYHESMNTINIITDKGEKYTLETDGEILLNHHDGETDG